MKSICLITCYMGPLPVYFDYFLASCKKNSSIDFVVISDDISHSYNDQNVRFIKMDLQELNVFASRELHEIIHLQSAWKINELKPLFGAVFQELLKPYEFWGWCDLDIIWGDLRHFLTEELLSNYDVVASKELWTPGHFTLLKNNAVCNNLYKVYPGIVALLNDPVYYAFEECCHRWHGKIVAFETLTEKGLPLSMFDLVKNAEAKGQIKALFKDLIREHPQSINYVYSNAKLFDLGNGEEFMYYHLITVKKIWRFFIPPYKAGSDTLMITPYGIRSNGDNKLLWFIKRAYSCYKGIVKSSKKQNAGQLLKKLFRLKRQESY